MSKEFHELGARAWSDQTALSDFEPTKTVQSTKDEADINVIVKRFGVTGMVPQAVRIPLFQDFDAVFDFHSAQNAIRAANESFMAMPADVRSRFANDPQRFIEFCSLEENLPEMRKLGLAVPEEPAPAPVDPAPPG